MKKASARRGAMEAMRGISAIAVEGFKSLRSHTEISIRPLTILAGANSSGKSSVMQAPLLLKQTLETSYDPGALLLDGPHVRFTAAEQLLPRIGGKTVTNRLHITITMAGGATVTVQFIKKPRGGFDVFEMSVTDPEFRGLRIRRGMSTRDILNELSVDANETAEDQDEHTEGRAPCVIRRRCFLDIDPGGRSIDYELFSRMVPVYNIEQDIRAILHVPALRGNPTRTYKTTAVGASFPGTFEPYVASVINHWQVEKDDRVRQLGRALSTLGLTWKIEAARVDDTQVELRVGRLRQRPREGRRDLVSIADVGFGMSQSLPVLVALLTAKPGQLVYLEEPEIHLHPKAQVALAQILAEAAMRGVRVVAETHSSLLLLGIQSLIAEGTLSPDLVALHWFSQKPDGTTVVKQADVDEAGAFGDWPVDFDEVTLAAQSRYLDAAEARLARR